MPRWLAVFAGVALVAAGAFGLLLLFSGRDEAQVTALPGPGRAFPDQCSEHVTRPPGFAFNSRPPTSGPHAPRLPARDGVELSDDELLHALELGNVVLAYETADPPAALRALQDQVAGAYDVELAAAGQAVVLARRADAGGIAALAWTRRLGAESASDPALRAFAEAWLGRGAPAEGSNCP